MTPEQMDADLKNAVARLAAISSPLTVDRSRHDLTTMTTLWLFFGTNNQVGTIVREGYCAWKANRMYRGSPISERHFASLTESIEHISHGLPIVEQRTRQ